jgi:hypothetical protein
MQTATPHGAPAWARTATIADYDGATDKMSSTTEGQRPYAAAFYIELRDNLRGSAFTKESGTLVHVENVAIARLMAALVRTGDKVRNNAIPSTADEKLDDWIKILNVVSRAGDSDQSKREECAAQYRVAPGPTRQVVDDAISELLGDLFVKVHRFTGADLDNPPEPTHWPTINPGPADYDLGGGTWLSARSHLVVEVTEPSGVSLADYYYLVDAKLFRLLNRILPAYVTADWAVNVDDGFALDVDKLDFGALNDP